MCTGRVDLIFILRAFSNGMDGVYLAGCRLDECKYTTQGNYYALNIVLLGKRILEHIGLNSDRLKIEFMSSAEANRFVETVNDFTQRIREIGPLGEKERMKKEELESKLNEMMKLVPYLKIATRRKLSSHLKNPDEWSSLFAQDEIENLFRQLPYYYIDPSKCQACMTCARRCPVDAILSGKNLIHIIDQEKCIKCGTCLEVCPPKFSAIQKLVGEAPPPPIPEEKRKIVRKGKEESSREN